MKPEQPDNLPPAASGPPPESFIRLIPTPPEGVQVWSSNETNSKSGSSKGKMIALLGVGLALLLGIGAAGYLYYRSNQHKPVTSNQEVGKLPQDVEQQQTVTPSNTTTAPTASSTASWTTFTSTSGSFSLKYPKDWLIAGCQGKAPEDSFIVLWSNSSNYLGACPDYENKPRQITVGYVAGSSANSLSLEAGVTVTSVTVGGVAAKKYVTTYTSPQSTGVVKNINYLVYAHGKNYTLSYCIYKDAQGKLLDTNLADFTTMVEKTVTFL